MFTRERFGKPFRTIILSTVVLGVGAADASAVEGVLLSVPATEGSYCHLKFPAIRESTLASNRPELKASGTGDIIDFYGPCDHDPLSKEAVLAQKKEQQREWEIDYSG